jgi:pre-rRNA-processing protein TSR4
MVLLLQLNGDLPEVFAGHERRLYIFTCRRKTCRRKEGSTRALRGLRISEVASKETEKKELQPQKPAINIGDTLFGTKSSANASSANPFSLGGSKPIPSNPFSTSASPTPANPFASPSIPPSESAVKTPRSPTPDLPKTFASALYLNSEPPRFGPPPPPEPWPEEASLPPSYPVFYLVDADYEILDKVDDIKVPIQTMDLDEGPSSSGAQKEDKDIYESTIDKTFQKFADRLAQNPEQVIRYEFNGQPLLYSKHDAVGKLLAGPSKEHNVKVTTSSATGNRMPRCENCGAGRVFEVQLTPHAIMELECEETSLDGMEWGTIIVGVCGKDCSQNGINGNVGYLEEWVGVQWEELK